MKLINLTPHAIDLTTSSLDVVSIPPSGAVARVEKKKTREYIRGDVTFAAYDDGEVVGLPAPCTACDGFGDVAVVDGYGNISDYILCPVCAGTLYITSAQVKMCVSQRIDVVSPGALIRDNAGLVIGCKELVI